MTEIDVKETLKNKLNIDFKKYKILGACNPPFAYQALTTDNKVGLLLPCNVVVQEIEEGKIEVSAVDPKAMLGTIDNPKMEKIATEVQNKLKTVIDSL